MKLPKVDEFIKWDADYTHDALIADMNNIGMDSTEYMNKLRACIDELKQQPIDKPIVFDSLPYEQDERKELK